LQTVTSGSTKWIGDKKLPVDLVAVAAFDDPELDLAYRGERPNPPAKEVRRLLRKAYPYIQESEVRQALKARGSKDWQIYLKDFDGIQLQTRNKGAPILVSTTFPHVSRRMACYWRKHAKYQIARRFVEECLWPSRSSE
jgi:hypothetical protein